MERLTFLSLFLSFLNDMSKFEVQVNVHVFDFNQKASFLEQIFHVLSDYKTNSLVWGCKLIQISSEDIVIILVHEL